MPNLYNVTLYYNTGFNRANVPDSPTVLALAESKTFEAIFRRHSRGVGSIKLECDYTDVEDADFCQVGNDYYIITGKQMVSNSTTQLDLMQEPICSGGGITAYALKGGWAERAHPADDTPFSNVLPEPWAPQNALVITKSPVEIHTKAEAEEEGNLNLIGSTVDLDDIPNYAARVYTAIDAEGASVVTPRLPALDKTMQTELSVTGGSFKYPGIAIYNMDDAILFIEAVREIGVSDVLTFGYVVPKYDVSATVQSNEGKAINPYATLASRVRSYPSNTPFIYATTKNKKATCLYNIYRVVSVSSGATMEFEAAELYRTDVTGPEFNVFSDPAPTGTVYCQPSRYEGQYTKRLEHAICGLQWLNNGLVMAGSNGASVTLANAARANRFISLNNNIDNRLATMDATKQTLDTGANIVSSALGLDLGGVAKGITDLGYFAARNELEYDRRNQNTQWRMGDNSIRAALSANVVAPETKFPVDVNASAYYGNSFMIYQIGLSSSDLARFDNFLEAYGYAQDRPLTSADFTSRTKFNYVKASDALFSNPTVSMDICQMVSDMLANGVRIWHKLPAAGDLQNNPEVTT